MGGLVQIIEFVFAPPAIAMAVAAYIHQRFGGVPVELIAIGAYLLFTGLNAWGVRQAALFELAVTVLAVGFCLLGIFLMIQKKQRLVDLPQWVLFAIIVAVAVPGL